MRLLLPWLSIPLPFYLYICTVVCMSVCLSICSFPLSFPTSSRHIPFSLYLPAPFRLSMTHCLPLFLSPLSLSHSLLHPISSSSTYLSLPLPLTILIFLSSLPLHISTFPTPSTYTIIKPRRHLSGDTSPRVSRRPDLRYELHTSAASPHRPGSRVQPAPSRPAT